MPKLSIKAGSTNESVDLFIQDSSKTDGSGLTGLLYNSAGLTAYYNFARGASTQITLATLASATAAYASGGFKEIDSTNQPGVYRFDIPNATLVAGSGRYAKIMLKGATNMVPCLLEIELTGWDNQNAINGGITALPATACSTNSSLITAGTGTNQLSVSAGKALATVSSYSVGQDPATLVLDVDASVHNLAGTIGQKINAAGAAGDPWSTLLPGSYPSGSAGYLIGNGVVKAYASGQDPATLILGATASSWNTAGTIGNKINAGGSAGDPWGITLPGAYAAGTAGNIIGNRIDAAVTSRLPNGPVSVGDYETGQDPATLVLDVASSVHNAAGTIGQKINSAGTSADPWLQSLPGAYTAGTAGYIIGHNLDNTITSRQPLGPVQVNSYFAGQDPATLVLGATASSWNTAGTIGQKINAGGAAGDPWGTLLPGSYAAGTAGNIVGSNLNAPINSRLAAGPVIVGNYITGQDPASLVLQATAASFNTPGTIGAAINLSAIGGDVWSTILPGSYPVGSAGSIIGNSIDAKISSRQQSGPVSLLLTQTVPTSNAPNSVGECLNGARVQSMGNWVLDPVNKQLHLYNHDGSEAVRFTLDNIPPTNRIRL